MNHPTFADNAFIAVLDKRLNERFIDATDCAGEEVSAIIAECFRAWWADPLTKAVHHPLELRELAELMTIHWSITAPSDASSFSHALAEQQRVSRNGSSIGPSATASAGGPSPTSSSLQSQRHAK